MNKKIKVGIVGMGRAGRGMHIPECAGYPDCFEIAAVADNDPERLENLPEAAENALRYHSLEEMLANPELKLISIATRHPDHVPMALKILAAGKAAFVDKPYACGMSEMKVLENAAKQYPGKLFLRHNRRFEAAFVKAKQLVDSGTIGKINYIKLYRSVGFCRRNDWMTIPEFYGGLLSNWGPHLIDQALQFLDSPVVEQWSDVRSSISIGAGDDTFKILLKAENGRLADIEVSGANAMPGREMEIVGTLGTLVYPVNGKIAVRRVDPAVELKKLEAHPGKAALQYGNFDETLTFVEMNYDISAVRFDSIWKCIYDTMADGKPFPITIDDGLKLVKIIDTAFEQSGFEPIRAFRSKL